MAGADRPSIPERRSRQGGCFISGHLLGTLNHGLRHHWDRKPGVGTGRGAAAAPGPVPFPDAATPADPAVGGTAPDQVGPPTRQTPTPAGWGLVPWALALVTLVLRLATGARGPTDWDSAQYASAVDHFDVVHGQPQPPGLLALRRDGAGTPRPGGAGTIASLVIVAALASRLPWA